MSRVICVFACWLAVAYGGIIPWSQSGEEYAISLYQQYCAYGDKGENGDIKWYCKNPPPGSDEEYEHNAKIHGQTQTQKQVIFLQTPSKKIKHKVHVTGQAGVSQDTSIYVLPPKITHQVDVQGKIETHSENGKPHTFFLKRNPGASGGGSGGGGGGGYPPSGPAIAPWAPSYPSAPSAPYSPPATGYNRRHRKRSHRTKITTTEIPAPTFEDFAVNPDTGDYSGEA